MSTTDIPEGLEELFQQTWFDHFLHYALFLGAIFQLVCIAAIVIIPPKSDEEDAPTESDHEGAATNGKRGQDGTQVVKGSGPGAPPQGGVTKNKGSTARKARKRK